MSDAQQTLLSGVKFLLDMCRRCAGVQHAGLLMHSSRGPLSAVASASSSHTLETFSERFRSDPMCQVLHAMLSGQGKTWGDSGWLCCYIGCRLIELGFNSSVPITTVIDDINRSLRHFKLDIHSTDFTACSIAISWSDPGTVLALTRSLLRPALSRLQFSDTDEQSLAVVVATAFTSSVVGISAGDMAPYVHFEAIISPRLKSCLFRDSLVLDIPCRCHFSSRKCMTDVQIAVFEESLEIPVLAVGCSYDIDASNMTDTSYYLTELERGVLRAYADVIGNSNVNVLFCQRRIHRYLDDLLKKRGIMTVQRISIRYISALARLSGARLMGSLHISGQDVSTRLPKSSLGALRSVEWKIIRAKHYLICKGIEGDTVDNPYKLVDENIRQRMKPVMSVILCGLNESYCSELKAVCEKTIKILSHCLKVPQALYGAGYWQHVVGSKHLEQQAQCIRSRSSIEYTECDQFLGLALREYAAIVNKAYSGSDIDFEANISFLSNSIDREFGDEIAVLDCYASSICAIENGVEAACCILSIDGVVTAKLSGDDTGITSSV